MGTVYLIRHGTTDADGWLTSRGFDQADRARWEIEHGGYRRERIAIAHSPEHRTTQVASFLASQLVAVARYVTVNPDLAPPDGLPHEAYLQSLDQVQATIERALDAGADDVAVFISHQPNIEDLLHRCAGTVDPVVRPGDVWRLHRTDDGIVQATRLTAND